MSRQEVLSAVGYVRKGATAYPKALASHLGREAPSRIAVLGSATRLSQSLIAFFCSKECPGATILKAFDQVAAWRDEGRCVIRGFHAPMEKQCFDILLRGKQPIVMCPARSIENLRVSPEAREAIRQGRLILISPFTDGEKRPTADLARQRNRFIAALADEVVFAHVRVGGSLENLAVEIEQWGIPSRRLHN